MKITLFQKPQYKYTDILSGISYFDAAGIGTDGKYYEVTFPEVNPEAEKMDDCYDLNQPCYIDADVVFLENIYKRHTPDSSLIVEIADPQQLTYQNYAKKIGRYYE